VVQRVLHKHLAAITVEVVLQVAAETAVLVVMGHKTAPTPPTFTQVVGQAQDLVWEAVMDTSYPLLAQVVKLRLAAVAEVTEAEVVVLVH
jgi:hypothetical protein